IVIRLSGSIWTQALAKPAGVGVSVAARASGSQNPSTNPPDRAPAVFRKSRRDKSFVAMSALLSRQHRRQVDRAPDARIGAAAADIAGHRVVDIGVGRLRLG